MGVSDGIGDLKTHAQHIFQRQRPAAAQPRGKRFAFQIFEDQKVDAILLSDVVKDYSRTLLVPAESAGAALGREFRRIETQARADLRREGFGPRAQRLERRLDLRYHGQAYELTLPYERDFVRAFHRAHAQRYGYADPARPVEVVTVRLRALGLTRKPPLGRVRRSGASARAARLKRAPVWFDGRRLATDFYIRERLRPGNRLRGPAVVAEYSATTVVPPGWRARVDPYENLLLERG